MFPGTYERIFTAKQHGTAPHSTAQLCKARDRAAPYCTVPHRTAGHATARRCTAELALRCTAERSWADDEPSYARLGPGMMKLHATTKKR